MTFVQLLRIKKRHCNASMSWIAIGCGPTDIRLHNGGPIYGSKRWLLSIYRKVDKLMTESDSGDSQGIAYIPEILDSSRKIAWGIRN